MCRRAAENHGLLVVFLALCAAAFARLPHTAILHHRRPCAFVLSRNSNEQTDPSHTPNTAWIGLENLGVRLDGRRYIQVNERLETTAPGVWAIGECAGSPQFTHVSEDDFRVIRDNLAGGNRTTRGRLIPFCLYTDP
jgi:hypothetical protein